METIVSIFMTLPMIGVLIFTAVYPEESLLFGHRSQFKNENLEPREEVIKETRIKAIIALVIFVLVIGLLLIT